jgi:hypothetical protein
MKMAKRWKAKVDTCKFVRSSDVFEGLGVAWDLFSDLSKFSWGDNNRSLVSARRIYEVMHDADDGCLAQVTEVLFRLEKLGDTLVDLEN